MKPFKALFSALLLLPFSSLSAATVVNPEIAGYIRAPANGYFNDQQFFTGDTGADADNRSLNGILQFDLSGIDTSERQLSKVSLVLTIANLSQNVESSQVVTFQLYTLEKEIANSATWLRAFDGENGSWEVAGATGESDRGPLVSSVSLATSDYSFNAGGTGKTIVFESSTNFLAEVQSALDGDGILGFWVGLNEGDITNGERHTLRFASHLHSIADYHPRLVLEWEPIPEGSTLAFLAVGGGLLLGALKGARLRRKQC